ncbi:MAG: DUF2723 domain-containing protein [Candidatus Kapabacteria bacterium]|nr:DUF2723 domain-containing protein [Candidatus Kapabacteria bacterium]
MKISRNTIYLILSFLIPFIIYIITAAPDVTFTDSGELAGAAVTLGVAHPTGYPLFTILGFLWSLLPLPFSKIYSLNLFSGFLTSLSSLAFFIIAKTIFLHLPELNKSEISVTIKKGQKGKKTSSIFKKLDENNILLLSFISALFFSFALTIWSQAVYIEVYSLQILIINLVILFLIKATFEEENKARYFLLSALMLGLGFTNHMSSIMLIPAFIFIFFKQPAETWNFTPQRLKFGLILLITFLLSLSLYIYLPLRSSALPEFNWGWVHRGFDYFLYHVQGKQFQEWMGFTKIFKAMFGSSQLGMADTMKEVTEIWNKNAEIFFRLLPGQLAWLGLIPLIFGFYITYKISKTFFFFLSLIIIFCIAVAFNYPIHDIDSYFSTAYIGLIIFASIGLYWLATKYIRIIPFLIALPLLQLIINFSENDRSDDVIVKEYTHFIANNLEPNAVILSSQWDYWLSAFWYKQRVEGYRKDVTIIDKELLRRTWYLPHLKMWYPKTIKPCDDAIKSYDEQLELFEHSKPYDPREIQARFINMINCIIDKNYESRPIYITADVFMSEGNQNVDNDIGKGYNKIPVGFVIKLTKDTTAQLNLGKFNVDKFAESLRKNSGHLVDGIKTTSLYYLVDLTANYALRTNQNQQALKALKLANKIAPENEQISAMIRRLETGQ